MRPNENISKLIYFLEANNFLSLKSRSYDFRGILYAEKEELKMEAAGSISA